MTPQAQTTLPPPGDSRREVLRERTDALAEQAETRADALEIEPIDPAKLRVENELAQHFNELSVSNADPAYAYLWAQSAFAGRFIKLYAAQGWEVVQGEMPEAMELKGMLADTTRRLGDVILMRMRRDKYKLLQRRNAALRQAREEGVAGNLVELTEKANQKYNANMRVVGTDAVPGVEPMNPKTSSVMIQRAAAQSIAATKVDQLIREGRMPGAPAPRGGRRLGR